MPRDLADKIQRTGIFSLGVPRAIGGREAPPTEIMEAIETAASADGSTGWCAMIATANNVVAGYMNEVGAKEVFADPTAPSAGIAAPAGTPNAIVSRLNREMVAVLALPKVIAVLSEQGFDAEPGTPEAMSERISRDVAKLSEVVEKTGIRSK